MNLEEEIKQTKGFSGIEEKTIVNIIFTSNRISTIFEEILKQHGLSNQQQYNILRILRGNHPEGLCIQDLKYRMLDKNSDVSRLVDKLLSNGLVSRTEDQENRRKVVVKITIEGLNLLTQIQPDIQNFQKILNKIPSQELQTLNEILDSLRTDINSCIHSDI